MFDRLREKLGDFRKSIDEKLKASPPAQQEPVLEEPEPEAKMEVKAEAPPRRPGPASWTGLRRSPGGK